MPDNIPTIGPTPDVQPQAMPTPFDSNRVTPENFGAGAGQVTQQAGELANRIAEQARDRANLSAVLAARGTADTELNDQILSDSTGFRSLKGHDALGGADDAVSKFDTTLQKIGDGLSNDEQKRAFAQYGLTLKQEAFRHVQTHLAQQANVVDADSYKTAQTALINKLGALPVALDPQERAKQLSQVELSARARAIQIFGRSATQEEISNFTIPAKHLAVEQALETLKAAGTPQALTEAKNIINDPGTRELLGSARTALVEGEIYRRDDQQSGLGWARAAATSNRIPGTSLIDEEAAQTNLDKLAAQPNMRQSMLKIAQDELHKLTVDGRQQQKQRNDAAYVQLQSAIIGGQPEPQKALDVLSNPNSDSGDLLTRLESLRYQVAQRRTRGTTTQEKEDSLDNKGAAYDFVHSEDNKEAVLKMTRDQFSASLDDPKNYPGGFTTSDRLKVLDEFDKVSKASSKLDEPVGSTVRDALAEAFGDIGGKDSSETMAQFRGRLFGVLLDKANLYAKQHKGEVDTEKLRKFVQYELATGTIKGTGLFFDRSARRIEAELNPEYAGKTFTVDGEPDETIGSSPGSAQPRAQVVPAQPTKASPVAPAPSDEDKAALDWLAKNPAGPAADRVRAKLKSKGIVE